MKKSGQKNRNQKSGSKHRDQNPDQRRDKNRNQNRNRKIAEPGTKKSGAKNRISQDEENQYMTCHRHKNWVSRFKKSGTTQSQKTIHPSENYGHTSTKNLTGAKPIAKNPSTTNITGAGKDTIGQREEQRHATKSFHEKHMRNADRTSTRNSYGRECGLRRSSEMSQCPGFLRNQRNVYEKSEPPN